MRLIQALVDMEATAVGKGIPECSNISHTTHIGHQAILHK
jgi:hypothetical protein